MIHTIPNDQGDREVYDYTEFPKSNVYLGKIECGQAEFQFVPDDLTEDVFPARRYMINALKDARLFAQGRDQ